MIDSSVISTDVAEKSEIEKEIVEKNSHECRLDEELHKEPLALCASLSTKEACVQNSGYKSDEPRNSSEASHQYERLLALALALPRSSVVKLSPLGALCYERLRDEVISKLREAYRSRSSILKKCPFSGLGEKWKRDKLVALEAIDLDPSGRILQLIPVQDRELVAKAVSKAGTNLAYVKSDSLKNDASIAFAAITQTPKACKHIGEDLKCDKDFVIEMLKKLTPFKHGLSYQNSEIKIFEEPKRQKANKYYYAVPKSWPGNFSGGSDSPEFGDGTFELPFGTDIEEALEERKLEIVGFDNYAGQSFRDSFRDGQSATVAGVDESLLHDDEVKDALFEVDCVAVLFNDMTRREILSVPCDSTPKKRMRENWKKLVDAWHTEYGENKNKLKRAEVQRLQCWTTNFWKQLEGSPPIAVADNIHFWIECVRRTGNRSLLAEAPQDMLTDEDKMLEAIKIDISLFRITPWKLRVSASFKKKIGIEMEDRFLWITLEDARAQIPSKARDSEMGEMIAAFAAVQKLTGVQQHQVPFLQLKLAD